MWGTHYKSILNCMRDQRSENALCAKMNDVMLQSSCSVYHSELREILQGLSNSEPLGVGGLNAARFK